MLVVRGIEVRVFDMVKVFRSWDWGDVWYCVIRLIKQWRQEEVWGNGEEEVKKAKAAPDLVADAGERRNSMTAGCGRRLYTFAASQTVWQEFANGEK
jgi:hypothetical protein